VPSRIAILNVKRYEPLGREEGGREKKKGDIINETSPERRGGGGGTQFLLWRVSLFAGNFDVLTERREW